VWDQRGAGKSYAAVDPEAAMNIGQFVADTHELADSLRRRFHQGKIYLAGHSWGSVLGVLTVRQYPELFHAYVGIGQVVNMKLSPDCDRSAPRPMAAIGRRKRSRSESCSASITAKCTAAPMGRFLCSSEDCGTRASTHGLTS
jgi:pimeloyl-ACP methyl ester carboxylesterase